MKQTEILIYGLKQGETREYMEDLLSTNCKTKQDIEKVLKVASEHGFHSFRITHFNDDGKIPDFAGAINI